MARQGMEFDIEQYLIDQEVKQDYHPSGLEGCVVVDILQHSQFPELKRLSDNLVEVVRNRGLNFNDEIIRISDKISEIKREMEKDIEDIGGYRPNEGEFRTAVRVAYRMNKD